MLSEERGAVSLGGEAGAGNRRALDGWPRRLAFGIGVAMTAVHLLVYTNLLFLDPYVFRSLHLSLAAVLAFLLFRRSGGAPADRPTTLDVLLALAAIFPTAYIAHELEQLVFRIAAWTTMDVVAAAVTLLVVLELGRRMVGPALPILAMVFLGYALAGPLLPGFLAHRGFGLERILVFEFTQSGVFGVPLGVSAEIVFLFVLFGAFLQRSGVGAVFTEIAQALAGSRRGGPAKVAVVASGFFGMISGSAAANVAVDGNITIPLMKSVGYRAHFAAAVEATASTGGMIMPPVMGAGAFLMADYLGVPYGEVALAAAIPGFLYYFCLYWMIDLEAKQFGLAGAPRASLPEFGTVLRRRGYRLVPVAVLLYFLLYERSSITRAALSAIVAVIAVSVGDRSTRFTPGRLLAACYEGAEGILTVAAATACAGITIGALLLTGLGAKLSQVLIRLSGENLLIALVVTSLLCLILGTGLPPVASYAIPAAIVVPSLVELGQGIGLTPMAAHLFVFYFASIGAITPPDMIAVYVASGIARSNVWTTALTAMRIGGAIYFVPFMFAYGPALLMQGAPLAIGWSVATACLGCLAFAAGVQGYWLRRTTWWERALLLTAALCLVSTDLVTDAIGLGLVGLAFFSQRSGRAGPAAAPVAGGEAPAPTGPGFRQGPPEA
jgi:TRAP transporter 4TM/12TM fusion protein